MKTKFTLVLLLSLGLIFSVKAEMVDTIKINASTINTSVLKEGTHRYLVYMKMKKDSVRTQTQYWTREIKRSKFQGRNVIEINQSWEDKDSIMHIVKSISDAQNMQPLYHHTWWKVQRSANPVKVVSSTTVDFINNSVEVDGKQLFENDTSRRIKPILLAFKSAEKQFHLNWHSDLETFPVLPYKDNVVFEIPFYDPGTGTGLTKAHYKVEGSASLSGYNDQVIDCWLLVHQSPGNKEVFWVSKKTKEVLKLEQEINGAFYRYKIKLGFSI